MSNAICRLIVSLSTEAEQAEVAKLVVKISRKFPDASGLIIALIDENGEASHYWDGYVFLKFGDPLCMENPKTYSSPASLDKAVEHLRTEYPSLAIDAAFWWHPDVGPGVAKYMKMTGGRFYGSVRR